MIGKAVFAITFCAMLLFCTIDTLAVTSTTGPATAASDPGIRLIDIDIDGGKYTATINTTETPDLTDWANNELAPVVVEWYPKLVAMLPSPGYAAPTHFSITFRKDKPGVADTTGNRINCAAAFFRTQLHGQAKGAIVHEMVHVVQQYPSFWVKRQHPDHNPGWLIEGLADYIRWYKYQPQSNGAAISAKHFSTANYDGSYRITANFMNWVTEKYDKNLAAELNAAMRQGNYSPEIWQKLTGKSVEDLNIEWKTQLAASLGIKFSPATATSQPVAR